MKVLMCGGGTGGHIYPALALARYLTREQNHLEILFVGGERGLENRLVPREGFNLECISIRSYSRSVLKSPSVIWNLSKSSVQVRGILKRFKPQVAIGTGGYVSGPVIFWARAKKIPTLIHEQNAIPGKTNRVLAPWVNRVCLSFENSGKYFSNRANTLVTGNPRASEVQACSREESFKKLDMSPRKKTLLVFGGSQGAWKINQVMIESLRQNLLPEEIQVLYITGEKYYREVKNSLPRDGIQKVHLYPYLYEMPAALAIADLVVGRAGATAIAEITAQGVPSLLIPSPNVVDNHQYYNARILEEKGAARVILEKDFSSFTFSHQVGYLFSHFDKLKVMAENSRALGMPRASQVICQEVHALVKNNPV